MRGYRGDAVRSKRRLSQAADDILDRQGSRLCVFELQGSLFFSTMEQILRRIMREADSFSCLILDFTHVLQIDECAVELLSQMDDMLKSIDKTLVLVHVPDYCAVLFREREPPRSRPDIDSALEWCEDLLLQQAAPGLGRDDRQVAVAAMDNLSAFTPNEIGLIESVMEKVQYDPGEIIIREGDNADSLFLLAAGQVNIQLSIKSGPGRQRRTPPSA